MDKNNMENNSSANSMMDNVSDGIKSEQLNSAIDYIEILKSKKFDLFFKRVFDLTASGIGLACLMPVFVIIAFIIKFTSKGPVLFRQKRVGKNGKPFKIMKFRTMIVDAESKGLLITDKNDPRITKIGKILRKLKLDELPQLFNVFVGQMSLVGPRPQTYFYFDQYTDYQKQQFSIRPGITGAASLTFSNEESIIDGFAKEDRNAIYMREIVPIKTELNLDYITKLSLIYDIKVIFKTFFAIIKK